MESESMCGECGERPVFACGLCPRCIERAVIASDERERDCLAGVMADDMTPCGACPACRERAEAVADDGEEVAM